MRKFALNISIASSNISPIRRILRWSWRPSTRSITSIWPENWSKSYMDWSLLVWAMLRLFTKFVNSIKVVIPNHSGCFIKSSQVAAIPVSNVSPSKSTASPWASNTNLQQWKLIVCWKQASIPPKDCYHHWHKASKPKRVNIWTQKNTLACSKLFWKFWNISRPPICQCARGSMGFWLGTSSRFTSAGTKTMNIGGHRARPVDKSTQSSEI